VHASRPDLQYRTSLGHSRVSLTGGVASASSNLYKFGRKKDLPLCAAAMELSIPYVCSIALGCLFVATRYSLIPRLGSSTLYHESVLYAIVSHRRGTHAAAAAPSRFFPPATCLPLTVLALSSGDNMRMTKMTTNWYRVTRTWKLLLDIVIGVRHLQHERQFLTPCESPLASNNPNWPPIVLLSAATSIGGCDGC